MIFKEENGRCFAELANGDVVEFESAEEMSAAEREWCEIQALFGHSVGNSESGMRNSELMHKPKKKKVRITIDTDVEYLGNKKALA